MSPENFGITCVDTAFHRPRMAAIYLLEQDGRVAIIETGTAPQVHRVLDALEKAGHGVDAVDYVIVTHVHLDHAGGAGALMETLPNAKLVVHPRGARHMIDPSKLIAGATEVYGSKVMANTYGTIVPVPAERVLEAPDQYQLELAGRSLRFFDTPGHAKHHFCVWDEHSRGIFTGDTFGLSYREFDTERGPFAFPTTTPVQFDPEALEASMQNMVDLKPQRLFFTHFGEVGDIERVHDELVDMLTDFTELARRVADANNRHDYMAAALNDLLLERLAVHGCTLPVDEQVRLLAMDVDLNAQGLGTWLDAGG